MVLGTTARGTTAPLPRRFTLLFYEYQRGNFVGLFYALRDSQPAEADRSVDDIMITAPDMKEIAGVCR